MVCFQRVKKIIYFHFLVKIQADFLFSIANLWNFCHETSKITLPELFKIFEIGSHQRRTLDLYPARMKSYQEQSVLLRHRLRPIRVKMLLALWLLLYFFKRFRSFNDKNLGSVGQRAAKLPAIKLWEWFEGAGVRTRAHWLTGAGAGWQTFLETSNFDS